MSPTYTKTKEKEKMIEKENLCFSALVTHVFLVYLGPHDLSFLCYCYRDLIMCCGYRPFGCGDRIVLEHGIPIASLRQFVYIC